MEKADFFLRERIFSRALSSLNTPMSGADPRPGAAGACAGERPFAPSAAADCGFCAPRMLHSHMQQVAGREGVIHGHGANFKALERMGSGV